MSAPPERDSSRRIVWLAAVLITAAIVGLHFYLWFHAGGLWRDEVQIVNLSGSRSLLEMTHDSFPLLMPLLVRGWCLLGLGHSDLALRLLGTLIGLAMVAVLWLAAWTARRSPPLLSLLLLALNTRLIFYGDSLRAYGLGSMLIALTTGSAWAFLEKNTWRRAVLFALAALLSVQALFQNAVLVAAVCFGAWTICWQRKNLAAALKILVAAIVAAAALLPYWTRLASLPANSVSLRSGFSPLTASNRFIEALGSPFAPFASMWVAGVFVLTGLTAVNLLARKQADAGSTCGPSNGNWSLFAGTTMLAALAGYAGFLWFAAVPTEPWYFLPLMAVIAVCFEIGLPLARLPTQFRPLAPGVLALIGLVAIPAARQDLNRRFTNVDILAHWLQAHASPEDCVVVVPWQCGISFNRYYDAEMAWQTLPPLADHARHRYDLVQLTMRAPDALQPVYEKIRQALQSGHRVWILGTIRVPKNSTPAADDSLPAPRAYAGSSDTAYTAAIGSQLAGFLAGHSTQIEPAGPPAKQPVNSYEDLDLLVATGWRTSPAKP